MSRWSPVLIIQLVEGGDVLPLWVEKLHGHLMTSICPGGGVFEVRFNDEALTIQKWVQLWRGVVVYSHLCLHSDLPSVPAGNSVGAVSLWRQWTDTCTQSVMVLLHQRCTTVDRRKHVCLQFYWHHRYNRRQSSIFKELYYSNHSHQNIVVMEEIVLQ